MRGRVARKGTSGKEMRSRRADAEASSWEGTGRLLVGDAVWIGTGPVRNRTKAQITTHRARRRRVGGTNGGRTRRTTLIPSG